MANGDDMLDSDRTSSRVANNIQAILAALEKTVELGFKRLDEKMDRFQNDLHDNQITTNDRLAQLDKEFTTAIEYKRARIDGLVKEGQVYKEHLEKRLVDIETWMKVSTAKVAVIMSLITFIAMLTAPYLRQILGINA